MAGARVDSKNIDAWATPPRISSFFLCNYFIRMLHGIAAWLSVDPLAQSSMILHKNTVRLISDQRSMKYRSVENKEEGLSRSLGN